MDYKKKYLKYKIKYLELLSQKGGVLPIIYKKLGKNYYTNQGNIFIKIDITDQTLIDKINLRKKAINEYLEDNVNPLHITLFDIKLNMDSKIMINMIKTGINIKSEINKIITTYLTGNVLTLEYINGYDGYSILGDKFLTKIFTLDDLTINILKNMFNDIISVFLLKGKNNGTDYKIINDEGGINKIVYYHPDGTIEEVACYQNWNNYFLDSSNTVHITIGKIKESLSTFTKNISSLKQRFLYDLISTKQFPPLIIGNKYNMTPDLYKIINSSGVSPNIVTAIMNMEQDDLPNSKTSVILSKDSQLTAIRRLDPIPSFRSFTMSEDSSSKRKTPPQC